MSFPWRYPSSRSGTPRRVSRSLAAFESLESRVLLSFDPTPMEQAFMESLNRARLDPQGELDVYFSSLNPLTARDSNVQGAIQYFGVDVSVLLSQWAQLVPAPPLAWNEILSQTATDHNERMVTADQQEHVLPGELGLGERIREAGYNFRKATENIYAFAEGHIHGHAGFMVDWGEGPGGIQSPAGHRINIMDPDVIEVGIDVLAESSPFTAVGPFLVTQDFGQPRVAGDPYIVGVVWQDRNSNRIYDPGEGIKDTRIVVTTPTGVTYETKSMTAGGYQLQVPPGTYQVNASGAGFTNPVSVPNVVVASTNVKVDFHRNDGLQPPVAVIDTVTMSSADSIVINVLANDFDPDGGLDPTSIRITSTPAFGTVQVNPDAGTITYRTGPSRISDTFYYTVRDMTGVISNPARVNVLISDSVQPPAANDDIFVTRQGESVSIPVLANDSDDSISLFVQWTSQPVHGQITTQGSEIRYVPSVDFFGLETLTYQAQDATNASSNQATVRIYVTENGIPWRNPVDALDVDGNGIVSPVDALHVINHLGINLAGGNLPPSLANGPLPFLDVAGDNLVTPIDALLVINNLTSDPQAPGNSIAMSAPDRFGHPRAAVQTGSSESPSDATGVNETALPLQDAANGAQAAIQFRALPDVGIGARERTRASVRRAVLSDRTDANEFHDTALVQLFPS